MTFGKRLYELRKRKGLSQEEVGDAVNVSRQTVSKWETDQSYPEFDKLQPLSKLFNITIDELVTGTSLEGTERQFFPEYPRLGYEFKSKTTVFGIPLVHINIGYYRRMRVAKGIIAIGNIAFGLVGLGVISFSAIGFSVISVALLSIGAVAIGGISFGALSLGFPVAIGKLAIGAAARGDVVVILEEVTTIISGEIQAIITQTFPNLWNWIYQYISFWLQLFF